MIVQAQNDFQINLDQSFMVGDKFSDIQCAIDAGLKGLQIEGPSTDKIHKKAYQVVPDFQSVPRLIQAITK